MFERNTSRLFMLIILCFSPVSSSNHSQTSLLLRRFVFLHRGGRDTRVTRECLVTTRKGLSRQRRLGTRQRTKLKTAVPGGKFCQ